MKNQKPIAILVISILFLFITVATTQACLEVTTGLDHIEEPRNASANNPFINSQNLTITNNCGYNITSTIAINPQPSSNISLSPQAITSGLNINNSTTIQVNTSVILTANPFSEQYSLNIIYTDNASQSQNTVENYTVTLTNDAPTFSVSSDSISKTQTTYTQNVSGTDVNNDPITYSLNNAPANASIDSTGLITWDPIPTYSNYPVTETFSVVANDSFDTTTHSFSVTINGFFDLYLDDIEINGQDESINDLDDLKEGDEVILILEVTNTASFDMENVEIELLDNNEWDVDDTSNDDDINDGATESFEIKFTVPATDEDSAELSFEVRGENQTGGEEIAVFTDFVDVEIEREDDDIEFTDLSISPQNWQTNSIELNFEVRNKGDNDLDDIRITIQNSELGIDEEILYDELDQYDDKGQSIYLYVPEDAPSGSYPIIVTVYHENNDFLIEEVVMYEIAGTEEEDEEEETPQQNNTSTIITPQTPNIILQEGNDKGFTDTTAYLIVLIVAVLVVASTGAYFINRVIQDLKQPPEVKQKKSKPTTKKKTAKKTSVKKSRKR